MASAGVQQKLRIADERRANIRIVAPVRGAAPTVHEIRTPDASFVKVHFDHFNLPAGLTLEVSSPDGSEVYRYSKSHRDGHTVDRALGQDGKQSFSAMSISGPVARLRLVGNATERWSAGHGVTVSRYLEGFPNDLMPALQKEGLLTGRVSPTAICGVNDKKAVACYQSTDASAFDRSRPVAKLVLGGGGSCTAWRVGPDNRMFTNNHCFTTTAEVAASEIWFNYQNTTCTGATVATVTKVAGDTMLRTDATLDYTLYTVKNFANISGFGYLGLEVRVPTTGEQIFIPQHAGGRVKELATVSDHVGGGACIIDTATQNGNGTNTDSGYKCDTEPGSSGSPVLARSSNKAIALHHLGGCNNSGAQFSQIWPQVSSHFGGVVPGGDSGGGNVAPTANFSFTTSSLTATFTDGSSDSDGTIASRSWNFGDGTTSTATSPGKTYAAAGTYTVTLTVTDNGGATNSINKSVTVGTVSNVLANGVPVTGLAASTGASLNYTMVVPAGATGLKFVTSGGTGDMDMYVKFGAAPTDTVYDCRPYASGNAETCTITTAQAGTYYVRLKAYSTFSGVSLTGSYTAAASNTAPVANFSFTTSGLTATFTDTSTDAQNNITSRSWNFGDGTSSTSTSPSHTYSAAGTYTVTETVTDAGGLSSSKSSSVTVTAPPACGGLVLCSGTAVALPSVATGGVSSNYTMTIAAGKTVTFAISGGTGDADMYVKAGSAPTSSAYDCRPYTSGNAESCSFTPSVNTTYYVNVRAYAAYPGVSLKGTSN
ncbi:MAG: pre-peptidase C-terminal domain-containing protein [Arenimonas sp.]